MSVSLFRFRQTVSSVGGGRGAKGKSVHEQEGRREEEEAQGGREGECEIVLSCLPYLN